MLYLQWSLYMILHTQIECSVSNFQHVSGRLAIDTPEFNWWFSLEVSTVFIYLLDYKKVHECSAPYPFCFVEIEMIINITR